MWNLRHDLRYALRRLKASPGVSAAVVLSLALGLGANTTVFSWVDAALWRPLPIAAPERVVSLHTVTANSPDYLTVSHPNFKDYQRAATGVFAALAVYRPASFSLAEGGEPELVDGQLVSASYFSLLGLEPPLGRFLTPEEAETPGGHPVVVLAQSLFERRFGGDPGVIGRTIELNGRGFTVIGVAPKGFRGARVLEPAELWVPLGMYRELLPPRQAQLFELRRSLLLFCLGRLAPGVDRVGAEAAMKAVAKNLEREHPDANAGRGVALLPIQRFTISPNYRGGVEATGVALLAVVGLVLLIACANVANLLLARSLARRKEIALRLALGVSRGALVRQLLVESLVLSLAGGAAGLGVAALGRKLLWASRPDFIPAALDVGLNPRVLVFTLLLALATGLVFGLAPALQRSRPKLTSAFSGAFAAAPAPTPWLGRFARGFGPPDLLVVTQVAMSLLALLAAASFLRALSAAQKVDPGFKHENLALVSFNVGARGYDETRGRELYRQLLERVEAVPGVTSAALAENVLLLGDVGFRRTVLTDGRQPGPGENGFLVQLNSVGVGYFDTVGIPIVRGRAFTADDRPGSQVVAIVNETMARELWPGREAVGGEMRFLTGTGTVTVVGVAKDSKYGFLSERPPMYFYLALEQSYAAAATLHVRTAGDPSAVLSAVQNAARSVDPSLPLVDVRTGRQLLAEALWAPRAVAGLVGAFGLLALVLAAVGVYGVASYRVSQTRREVAIRMAIGARRSQVVWQLVRRSLLVVAAGSALGLGAALFLGKSLSTLLYGVPPLTAGSAAAVLCLLAAVALAATYLPARRAAQTDPLEPLKVG